MQRLHIASRRERLGLLAAIFFLSVKTDPTLAATPQNDQNTLLSNVALAMAAYKASANICYYDASDAKIFSDADAYFTRKLPDVWPQLRDSAPDDLPMLQNTARILGGKSECATLGNVVGSGLIAAIYTGQLDATTGAEMDRLLKGGGRSKSDPAPAGPTTPPQRSAADTVAAMNALKAISDAKAARQRAALAAEPAYPGYTAQGLATPQSQAMVGPDLGATAGRQPNKPPVPAAQVPSSVDAQNSPLSSCLDNVDLGQNKNDQFARCYSSALALEDKRLNQEFNYLKGRIFDRTKLSKLSLAQHTWIDFRDRWCTYEGALDEAPSSEVNQLSCLVRLTSDQANRLSTSYLP